MALLELKDIGKIYVSNNNVAVGIRGVNLSFDSGEFVAITGKSGSGKSTLLNVISGMDTYEEGELYIEGNPTSHYIQSDWEEYRQKYISFIFQDYNIIDNFTVLQNVELALMNTYDPIERRRKALELLNRVGLSKAIHQKGSKLSGGQKQRTVIARALAKDSPIILADEPTGNLDSETSKEIIDLLYEVSRDKLVIVVTHNFEQVEMYATRHIRIYDGAVESDHVTPKNVGTDDYSGEEKSSKVKEPKKRIFVNGLALGRVMFFSKPKLTIFLCLLLLVGILNCFLSFTSSEGMFDLFKKNYLFTDIKGRVVLINESGTTITDNDLEELKNQTGASRIVHYDLMYDTTIYLDGVDCKATNNETFGHINGTYPSAKNEVFLYVPIYMKETLGDNPIGDMIYICNTYFKITGYKYYYDNTKEGKLLFSDEGFTYLTYSQMLMGSSTNVTLYVGPDYSMNCVLIPSFDLDDGKIAIFGDEYTKLLKNNPDYSVNLKISMNYKDNTTKVSTNKSSNININKNNIDSSFVRLDGYYGYDTVVYVSYSLLENMAKEALVSSYRQASLIYSSNSKAKKAATTLNEGEYIAVTSKTTASNDSLDVILQTVLNVFSLIGLLISLLFIAFFINLCTGRSVLTLKPDMSIMRSMGIDVKTIKVAMYVRVMLSLIPGYIILCALALVIYLTPSFNASRIFLHFGEYVVIVLGTLLIAVLVARKHIKKLFKQSVKSSLVGGGE